MNGIRFSKVCLFLCLWMGTITQSAFSAPITRQKAMQNVRAFLLEKGIDVKRVPMRQVASQKEGKGGEDIPFYVFNIGNDDGFVIASADDCAHAILGYSENGKFVPEDVPSNMQAWLDGYADEIDWARKHHVKAARHLNRSQTRHTVDQLLKSTWGQDSPYNDQCVFNGVNCVTGCTATALAQLMYYWATVGKDGKVFRCGSTALSSYVTSLKGFQVDSLPPLQSFDWDSMTDKKPTTQKGKKAVAQLMRYCGQAVKTEYTQYASGAWNNYPKPALIDKFGYSWNMRQIHADRMEAEEWDSIIYCNLAKGLPVYMDGEGTAGHAFICDGYDSPSGKYHFNWGWDGRYDGLYAMSALTPDNDNYSYEKTAIVDVLPFGKRIYAVLSPDSTVATIYNDTKMDTRVGTIYRTSVDELYFTDIRTTAGNKVREFVFDSSCEGIQISKLGIFQKMVNLKTIKGLKYLDTSKVKDMNMLFEGCSSLENLDLSHFDTRSVTTMWRMFRGCSSLKSLDLSHFNMQNVTSMTYMFEGCSSLETLHFGYNTQNVTSMSSLFMDCASLKYLDVSKMNTSMVNSMSCMFRGCSSLENLDVTHFDTKNVTNMWGMFTDCKSLKSLDLSHFDTSSVTNMDYLFHSCKSLVSVNVNGLDLSSTNSISGMFYDCNSLEELDLSSFDLSKITDTSWLMTRCRSLKKFKVSASMENLDDDACFSVADYNHPCKIYAPMGFNFGVDTSKEVFIWKNGYFTLPKESMPGDVNGDGIVDILDVTMTVDYILGGNHGFFDSTAADMDNDGTIGVSDVSLIVEVILGSST